MRDLISRQAAIDALDRIFDRCEEIEAHLPEGDPDRTGYKMYPDYMTVWKYLHQLPSAQPERDIPMKPNETIDSSWGIRKKQAVCPKCDYYLGRVEFIGNPNGKKVTYCETCGQAIDWEGWEWEEE